MLDRAKEHEWSTFDDPDYVHPGRDAASSRRAFSDAGWSNDEIDLKDEIAKAQSNEAPITSPGVARFTEAALHRLSQPIKSAAAQLNVSNRDKVHFAVEPKSGPLLSKINVVMTDQSIITMGSFFTRYCGLVSRAYIRTMLLAPLSVGNDIVLVADIHLFCADRHSRIGTLQAIVQRRNTAYGAGSIRYGNIWSRS